MILDDEDVLIDNLKNDYIHIDQLYKNTIEGGFIKFIEDALKILNKHKLTQYGVWKYKHGIFGFFTDNDPYNISLVNITYFYLRKPLISFLNITESYDFKKYHNITKKDYEKIINEIKRQCGDRVNYCEDRVM